jgi:hypothetical protein
MRLDGVSTNHHRKREKTMSEVKTGYIWATPQGLY